MTKSASQPTGRRRLEPIRPDRRPPARSIRRPDAMDRPSLIAAVTPTMTLVALFTGIALPFIAGSRSGRSHPGGRPPEPGANDAAPAGYLYVPCAGRARRSAAQSAGGQGLTLCRECVYTLWLATGLIREHSGRR